MLPRHPQNMSGFQKASIPKEKKPNGSFIVFLTCAKISPSVTFAIFYLLIWVSKDVYLWTGNTKVVEEKIGLKYYYGHYEKYNLPQAALNKTVLTLPYSKYNHLTSEPSTSKSPFIR